jgi:uncharacterized protein YdaL
MMPDKNLLLSAEYAHKRIDQLEEDLKTVNEHLEEIAANQQETTKQNAAIKWVLIGGLGFYVLETVGILGAIGLISAVS